MTSNILSRILPPNDGSPSIYETIQQHDEDSDASDVEERAGLSLQYTEEEGPYRDSVTGQSSLYPSRTLTRPQDLQRKASKNKARSATSRLRWLSTTRPLAEVEEAEDDVPASLLIEDAQQDPRRRRQNDALALESPIAQAVPQAGHADARIQRQWLKAREQQALYEPEAVVRPLHTETRPRNYNPLAHADRKQKAMWRWTNVHNLDHFLLQTYEYYVGHGFWSIVLRRCCYLAGLAFVVGFLFFLTQCINYGQLRESTQLSQITVPHCTRKAGVFPNLVLWIASLHWLRLLFKYTTRLRTLMHLHDFYHYLLEIPDGDIQTTSWQEVVSRLMALRDANPNTMQSKNEVASRRFLGTQNKQRMDAHDIANRLMRRDNYMIAMFNKDIFDMSLPIPFLGSRQFFSKTLEWNMYQTVFDFIFTPQGHIKPIFLKDTHRKQLSEALRRRFIFAGFASLFANPFIIVYNLIEFFFQNFNEYQKNPAQIGARCYTPYAEWKFREFNELSHFFERRTKMSYPFAARYVEQFPKAKTEIAARFVSFIAGAIVSVLFIASALDPDLFFGFEITHDRTVLFYIGLFGAIWAIARGMLPDDNTVHDTALTMSEIIQFTHYSPAHWHNRLASDDVRREFVQLYKMKLVIFFEELSSMFFTPFILWYSLPACSDRIIDFFREFTVHVDGIGYVCSFAEFNFQRRGTAPTSKAMQNSTNILHHGQANGAAVGETAGLRDDFYATNNQKLEASYWGFMNDYARNPKTDIRFAYTAQRQQQLQQQQSRFQHPPVFPGLLTSPTLPSTDLTLGQIPEQARAGPATATATDSRQTPSILNRLARNQQRSSSILHQSNAYNQPVLLSSPLQSILLDPHHQPALTQSTMKRKAKSPSHRRGSSTIAKKTAQPSSTTKDKISTSSQQDDQILKAGTSDPTSSAQDITPAAPLIRTSENSGDLGSWKMDNAGDTSSSSSSASGDDDGGTDEHNAANTQPRNPKPRTSSFPHRHHDTASESISGIDAAAAGGGVLGMLRQLQQNTRGMALNTMETAGAGGPGGGGGGVI